MLTRRSYIRSSAQVRHGYRVIRFDNDQVLHRIEEVLAAIEAECLPNAKGARDSGVGLLCAHEGSPPRNT